MMHMMVILLEYSTSASSDRPSVEEIDEIKECTLLPVRNLMELDKAEIAERRDKEKKQGNILIQ